MSSDPAAVAGVGGAGSGSGGGSSGGGATAAAAGAAGSGVSGSGASTGFPSPYPSLSVLSSPSAAQPPLSSGAASTAKGVQFSDSRKRRKRHADRVLPERVEVDVPESALFRSLLALERRLDAAIARRYVDLQEAVYTPQHVSRTASQPHPH